MTFDYDLIKKTKCGKREKEKCGKLIGILVRFAETARREGLLAIEYSLEELDSEFLRRGLRMVVDGTDPETVAGIMDTGIYMQGKRKRRLLEQFIIREGVLSIQQGVQPDILSLKLLSFLGDTGDRMMKQWETGKVEAYKAYLEELKTSAGGETAADGTGADIFGRLENRSVQKILREVDTGLLALALKGAGTAVKRKVFENLSLTAGMALYREIEETGFNTEERTAEALAVLKNVYDRLEEQGELA